MLRPNWFDVEFEEKMEKATAKQALAAVAKSPRLIKAVQKALDAYTENRKNPKWMGPSRTQVVRQAIAEVIQAGA